MKKRRTKKYRPGPVLSLLPKSDRLNIQIMSHVMVDKLAAGLFDEIDANTVAYELNITRRLAVIGGHDHIRQAADACMTAFTSMRSREARTGKWGASGPELQALRQHLGDLSDYFSRQPVHRGVDFVGHVIKPWHRSTRRRTVGEAVRKAATTPAEELFEVANSYFGLLRQAEHSHHDRSLLANTLRRRGHCIKSDLTKTYRLTTKG